MHSYLSKIKYLIYCSNCSSIPLLSIIPSSFPKFMIKCKCSQKTLSIEEYLQQFSIRNTKSELYCQTQSHFNKKAISYCYQCNIKYCYECMKTHSALTHHITFPINFSCDILNEERHQNSIAFCHNCNKHICTLCNTNHNEHYITNLDELDDALCNSLIDKYKKAKKGYVRILEETKNSMINKLINEIYLIQKSCDNCIKRNKEIFELLKIIKNNYLFIQEQSKCYNSIYNLMKNTSFTITKDNYKKLPKIVESKDLINFYNNFCVIQNNTIIEKSKPEVVTIDKIPEIKGKPSSICLFHDKRSLLIGTKSGELIIYDIIKQKKMIYIEKAHSKIITQLYQDSDSYFIGSVSHITIKVWINHKELFELYITIESRNTISTALFLPNTRICTLSKEGQLIIYDIKNTKNNIVLIDNIKNAKEDKYYTAFLSKDQRTLIVLANNIHFYDINYNIKYPTVLSGVSPNSLYSFYESKDNLLYIGGYNNSSNTLCINIVNEQSKQIETVIQFRNSFDYGDESILFFEEAEDSIVLKTNDGHIIEINKISKQIQKIIPLKQSIQNIIHLNTITHKLYVILFHNTISILKY